MVRRLACAVSLSVVVTAVPLGAECVVDSVPNLKRRATRVFEATVTSIKSSAHIEMLATVNVHRVWKGDARSDATVYFIPSIDGPVLEDGKRYIFFVQPLNDAARKAHGFPADYQRSEWVPPCDGVALPDDRLVKQLGRSRKPT
jgi:hypothetical protein